MSRMPRAEQREYGEAKKKYQFMLTPTASERLDQVAEKLKISRSEVFEQIIRGKIDTRLLKELK